MNVLFDEDGYPADEFLDNLSTFDFIHGDREEFLDAVKRAWHWSDWGFKRKHSYNGHFTLALHTGGWSGNEMIIHALKKNMGFWINHSKWRAGGHFYFNIKVKK